MDLDSVQIGGGSDLVAAARAYETLLAVAPVDRGGGGVRFPLSRGAVEIVPGPEGLQAIVFVATEADVPPPDDPGFFHGVRVRLRPAAEPRPPAGGGEAAVAIDHVVVHTLLPERAIALWRDRLGLRLAFDHEFSQRGLRLLFFRSAGITLEYATALGGPPPAKEPADRLCGVSYRVPDLERTHRRLTEAGVDVSPIRPGHRDGSRVATVRSSTSGVPTLLIERTSSAPS